MALKDLKSDLSKFRKPIEKPLIDKKRVEVPKSSNQTPLSQFVDKTPSAPKSNTTAPKQGVTPNKFDNSSNYLGETSQTKFDNSSNYLGETTPSKMSLEERFLGQTEAQEVQQGDKFKGETETTNIIQGDKFKGQTTPDEYSNVEKFKGETTPTEFKLTKQFLGETTPTEFSLTTQFLGETDPNVFSFNPNLESQGKDPKFVDFITNDDAKGFSPFQQPRNNSTFVGVDPSQTQFEGVTPISGKFVINQYGVTRENDGGLGTTYTDKLLKDTYNKFNLKEDSHNSSIFKQPFILSGIQREKGEPQTLGFGSFSFIRGGAITSTARAAIDVVRLGQFLLTPRGLTWSLKQVGMQRSQRYGKTWTPINLISNIGAQHLGLKFDRPGIQPIGDETWKYDTNGYLSDIYGTFRLQTKNSVLPLRVDPRGGFDSFYGIGVTTYNRQHNSFFTKGQDEQDRFANFTQRINPFDLTFDPFVNSYEKTLSLPNGDLTSQTDEFDKKTQETPYFLKSEGLVEGFADIKDYEFMSYGKIQKRAELKPSITNDFREDGKKQSSDIAKLNDYTTYNVEKRVTLPSPGKVGAKRVDWSNLSKSSADNTDRWDSVQGAEIGESIKNDLVHLFFYTDAGDTLQFRGTANGITETFSPSWNSEKYTGRADKAYMYNEFERTLSFNFKAYASSRVEMKPMWKKLQRLATFTMPEYSEESYNGKVVYFRLGNLYGTGTRGVPTIITSLTYTMSDEVSWDISPLGSKNPIGEIPKMVDISMGVTLLPEKRYEYRQGFYSARWL
mgnify:CR=1 FL=1